MEKNKKTAIVIAIIAIIVIVAAAAYFLGVFDQSTSFDTAFMSGKFKGDVQENNLTQIGDKYRNWSASFEDKNNNITYNMSCIKNGSFILDLYELQGMPSPETRHLGSNDWKIYYSEAVPTTNNTTDTNETVDVYICAAEKDGTTYMINVINYGDEVDCDGTLYCECYNDYIEPMLSSITLKDASGAPSMSTMLNISDDEFDQLVLYINQIKSGNITE